MTPLETNLAAALRANSALRVQAERPIAEYIEPCATGAALINDLIRLFDGIRPEPARAGADQENSVPDALATAPPVGRRAGRT
jgi:hypothetical protein